MKLKKLGVIVMVLALAVGGGTPNITYAMELQKQILVDGNYHMISPRISADGTTLYPEVYIGKKLYRIN